MAINYKLFTISDFETISNKLFSNSYFFIIQSHIKFVLVVYNVFVVIDIDF